MGSLIESGASLSASKSPCSSYLCLPKHQDCKHTWPHLSAYIGAGNLNSGPHGSATLLPTKPFLQPHKIHVVVSYFIPPFIRESECQEPALSDLQKVTWGPSEQKPRIQATNSLQDLRMLKYQCPCDSSSWKLAKPQETASEEVCPRALCTHTGSSEQAWSLERRDYTWNGPSILNVEDCSSELSV